MHMVNEAYLGINYRKKYHQYTKVAPLEQMIADMDVKFRHRRGDADCSFLDFETKDVYWFTKDRLKYTNREIIALAHEIGHLYDEELFKHRIVGSIYRNLEKGVTTGCLDLVLAMEYHAWDNSYEYLRGVFRKVPKSFGYMREESIESYIDFTDIDNDSPYIRLNNYGIGYRGKLYRNNGKHKRLKKNG